MNKKEMKIRMDERKQHQGNECLAINRLSNKLLYKFVEKGIFLNFSKRIFLFYKTNPDPQMTNNFNGFVKKKKYYLKA